MATADWLFFGLDYPTAGGPLYSNVNFASGHCFHAAAPVEAITLYLNGQYQDAALLGYPRLDVNQAYPGFGDRSLFSGFQCFESARAYAEDAGFEFGAYLGAIPSAESFFRYQSEGAYRQAADLYIIPESLALQSARFCPQQATITINHRAELDRCCVSWGSDAPVSLFDADLQKHLEQKTASAFCRRCLSSGYSYYKHFGTFRPDLLKP